MFSLVLCFVLISFVFVCVFCLLCLALCASFRFVETDIQSIQVWNDEKVNE